MKIIKPLPPHDLSIRLTAETMGAVRLYLRYQKEVGNEKWDVKDLVGEMVRLFLAEGDPDFLAWRTRQPSAVPVAPGTSNGASHD